MRKVSITMLKDVDNYESYEQVINKFSTYRVEKFFSFWFILCIRDDIWAAYARTASKGFVLSES